MRRRRICPQKKYRLMTPPETSASRSPHSDWLLTLKSLQPTTAEPTMAIAPPVSARAPSLSPRNSRPQITENSGCSAASTVELATDV